MTIEQSREIVKKYNAWRRDSEGLTTMLNPKELGQALDNVIEFVETAIKK